MTVIDLVAKVEPIAAGAECEIAVSFCGDAPRQRSIDRSIGRSVGRSVGKGSVGGLMWCLFCGRLLFTCYLQHLFFFLGISHKSCHHVLCFHVEVMVVLGPSFCLHRSRCCRVAFCCHMRCLLLGIREHTRPLFCFFFVVHCFWDEQWNMGGFFFVEIDISKRTSFFFVMFSAVPFSGVCVLIRNSCWLVACNSHVRDFMCYFFFFLSSRCIDTVLSWREQEQPLNTRRYTASRYVFVGLWSPQNRRTADGGHIKKKKIVCVRACVCACVWCVWCVFGLSWWNK